MAGHAATEAAHSASGENAALTPFDFPDPEEVMTGRRLPSLAEQAEAKRVANERAQFRQNFLKGLMSSADFREWLWEVLVSFGTFENAFGAGPTGFPDPMATQFQLGQKAAGWHLFTTFDNADPEMASKMRRDATAPPALS
jgi:hypothetical protein